MMEIVLPIPKEPKKQKFKFDYMRSNTLVVTVAVG
jgi:hypothetical protein